jgi:membrane-bound serine protease (ClpP class)
MYKLFSSFLVVTVFLFSISFADQNERNESAVFGPDLTKPSDLKSAYVIPIRDQIGPPILDILRRGMKEAISADVDLVILDMDTPGGELGVTLEIMQEILDSVESWKGTVLTYVNKEAISAGAYIAIATQEIAFAPFSQIGAAEAVSGGGGEIDPSMKRKINSYLKAKIRNFAGPYKYRSQVMAAMMDANVSLIIEGEPLKAADGSLIKSPGELLTLTGEEAVKEYGAPPQPLLGIGVFESIEDLLDQRWGKSNYKLEEMKLNWAEDIGLWLNGIAPLLLSVGLVLLFIEFKTPGFGIFGILGIGFILIFFGSKYVAGLAGQEEMLVFLLGFCLVLVEIFLAPGLFLPAILGLVMMFGSLIWAMADIWPNQEFDWTLDLFRVPLVELAQSIGMAVVLGYLVIKIMGKTPMGKAMILDSTVANSNSEGIGAQVQNGCLGITLTELYPVGKVEIDAKSYDARSSFGKIEKGEKIKVLKKAGFELVVEKDFS